MLSIFETLLLKKQLAEESLMKSYFSLICSLSKSTFFWNRIDLLRFLFYRI